MAATVNQNVDQGSGYAPLNDVMAKALMLYGDSSFDTHDGVLPSLLLQLANTIVVEVNQHPYREHLAPVEFYGDITSRRSIPDIIMMYGIAGAYATQQGSSKGPMLMAQFYKMMNQIFWQEKNGNTPIQVRAFDKKGISTDPINGLEAPRDEQTELRGRPLYKET
jgi:hypothetical protein